MLKLTLFALGLIGAFVLTSVNQTQAQIFGERTLRGALSPGKWPGSAGATVTGSERFVRGNRGATDVVGVDRRTKRNVVGSQQSGAARRRSSTAGLRSGKAATGSLNPRRRAASKTGRYEPRLQVAFNFAARPPNELREALAKRLNQAINVPETSAPAIRSVRVTLRGKTAVLSGKVGSPEDRILLGHLVSFEPGVARVQNDLTIDSALKAAPRRNPERDGSETNDR